MPIKTYRHVLVVEVVSEVDRDLRQMQGRLQRWLEAYGHTAVDYGFAFHAVDVPLLDKAKNVRNEKNATNISKGRTSDSDPPPTYPASSD